MTARGERKAHPGYPAGRKAAGGQKFALTIEVEEGKLGPKMLALPNDRWRRLVLEVLVRGRKHLAQAYEAAGFESTGLASQVNCQRVMRDNRFIEAFQEEARKRMSVQLLGDAVRAVEDTLDPDKGHKDKFRAAIEVFNRTGLHAINEQKVTVARTGENPEMLARIARALERLQAAGVISGVAAAALLPEGAVVEGEFEEIGSE